MLENPTHHQIRVVATRIYSERHRVYNLAVDDLHTYFIAIGDEDVLVHNTNCPTEPNSTILARNLEAAGFPRPGPGWEAHHIVQGKDETAIKSRQLLEMLGFDDINAAENGAWATKAVNNTKLRGYRYSWAVLRRIGSSKNLDQLIQALVNIRSDIHSGTFP
jgi:hypothetical protein